MIEAIFTVGVNTVTTANVTQWDKGRTLIIKGLDLPESCEVHYGNSINGEASVMLATTVDDGVIVDIPNDLLKSDHLITAWVYTIDTNQSKTVKTIIIPVNPRNKPRDFPEEENPTDSSMLAEFLENIDASVGKFREDMTNQMNELLIEHQLLTEEVTSNIDGFATIVGMSFEHTLLTTSWVTVDNVHTYTITVDGVTGDRVSIVYPIFNETTIESEQAEYDKLTYTNTTDNIIEIIAIANEKPSIDLNVRIEIKQRINEVS